jgi:hypothetical protein
MATRQRAAWVEALRHAGHTTHLTGAERERRQAEIARILAARDRQPSIAPDTTAAYIRQIRDEADARS